jgi:hypothetical protein
VDVEPSKGGSQASRKTHSRGFGLGLRAARPGLVEDAFDLTKQGKAQLTSGQNQFFAARMASTEVFGRLFEYEQRPEEVTAHVKAFGRIDPSLHTRWAIT